MLTPRKKSEQLSTDRDSQQGYYLSMVKSVRKKLSVLPAGSHIRLALPEARLELIERWVESSDPLDLAYAKWDALFMFINRRSARQLRALDRDLGTVLVSSKSAEAQKLRSDLLSGSKNQRVLEGIAFEVFAKSRSLRRLDKGGELDPAIGNKKPDIRARIAGRTGILECMVITESDYDGKVAERGFAAHRGQPSASWVRPGEFDDPDRRHWASAYDCIRIYDALFNKLAPGLDLRRTQIPEGQPAILLLSIPTGAVSMRGVKRAFDELFANQPTSSPDEEKPGNPDARFVPWLYDKAKRLCNERDCKGRPKYDWNEQFCADHDALIAAPQKIGALLVFDGRSFKFARVNYYAAEANRVTHAEVAKLEQVFRQPPGWDDQQLSPPTELPLAKEGESLVDYVARCRAVVRSRDIVSCEPIEARAL